MTIEELNNKISGEILCGDIKRQIEGCFIGDLLSLCMSKVQSGNLWITIQSNINVVAVASLTDAACVVICEGFKIDEKTLNKAIDEDVSIIITDKSAFEVVSKLLL